VSAPVNICLIAARARNGVIGVEGDLPWRLADDLAFFKTTTRKHPILMGRRTWESLPVQPLPGRDNIILTRNWAYQARGARIFTALQPALEAGKALARAANQSALFIVGGEAIYAETLPFADLLYLTEVDVVIEGDARFPDFDESQFTQISVRHFPACDRNQYPFCIRVLQRRPIMADTREPA